LNWREFKKEESLKTGGDSTNLCHQKRKRKHIGKEKKAQNKDNKGREKKGWEKEKDGTGLLLPV